MTASDWKQPPFVPVLATDGQDGGLYPAGADRWSATPIQVEPSAGALTTGLVPGSGSWLTAQGLNSLLYLLGKHVDASADVPSFQWTAHHALQPSASQLELTASETVGGRHTNINAADQAALLHYAGGGYFLMTGSSSNSGGGGKYRTKLGAGLGIGGSTDTSEWTLGGNASNVGGGVYATSVIGEVLNFAGSGGTPCTAKYSTDRGATWAGAGIAKGAGTAGLSTGAAFWEGNWYALDMRSGAGNYATYLVVADDPTFAAGASSTWTQVGLVTNHQGSLDQFDGRRIVGNSELMVILPRFGNVFGYSDGTFFNTTSLDTWSSTPTGWRGAWNGQIGLFMAANAQGQVYTSPDGATWTLVFTGAPVYDVAPHGRGFVLSVITSSTYYRLHYVDQSPEKTWRQRICLEAMLPAGSYDEEGAFHLTYGRGSVMAARIVYTVADGGDPLAEIYTSGVNPYDRIVFTGIGV